MIRQIPKLISLLLLFVSTSFFSYSQTTTVTFNEIPTTNSANSLNGSNTYNNSGVKFQIFSGSNSSAFVSYTDNGLNNTKALDDTNTVIGGVTGWKITKVDGTAFQLASIWLQNGCAQCSAGGTIKAFKNGLQVGSTETVTFNSQTTGVKNFASNPNFYNVDEIRIEGVDLYVYIDNFSFGPAINPVDADPPLVTSISVLGTPLSTATSVNYSVTFSKNAKNVSSDDFQVTTAGTVGTVGAVSGSGSSYTVTVNGIDGEGTIRLDLKGGTNIANVDDNTGTPAFTSGELHYVGACFVETFETETDASTSFSGNGVNFSLGTGFEIEKKTGFGAGGSNGYIRNNNTAGSFSLSSASEFTMSTIDLFLSDQTNGDNPTGTGSISITGKKGGVNQYTITKNAGFPTSTTVNGGFFTINFATDGAGNYRNINIDELVYTIGGGFIELAIDNMNFCESAPDVDNQAAVVQSISKIGNPLSTAGTVGFQVTFDEAASNVTLDDFTLLKTGTATGALTGISGSGSIYTLSITGISGEGSVQIKLNAGTNIQDALGNTPPFEFLNGEIHLVGACYIETFESFTNGATSFSSNGKAITLGGNWVVKDRNGFGINSSNNYLENTSTGPYSFSVDIPVKFSKLALFLTSNAGTNPLPTNDGTVTIRGKNGTTTEYTITKSTGFPTDFSSNSGYFYIDFATEGGVDNSNTYVDGLEIEIGGSFIYLAMDNLEFCSDFDAPAGYTATIDQDPIREKTANAASFTFADAEIGTTYNYSFSSDGGGTNVAGSGAIATATDQITGIDLSGLGVGTVTLSVTLTDPSGNIGDPATDTKQKIANNVPVATAPTAPVVIEDETGIPLADDIQVSDGDGDDQTLTFTITGGTVTLGTADIAFGGSGNGSAGFTAVGTLAALNTALDAATFTPTPGLVGTDAGTIAFVANDGLVDSNMASVTFDIGQKGPTETSLITVSRSSGDYDGNTFEATGGATGLGGTPLSPPVTFEYEQYDGSTWSGIGGAPTDAGAYRVRSNFAGNDEYIAGSSDWTAFAINQIAAIITVTRTSGDYNGNPFEATGSATGLEGALSPAVTFEFQEYDGSTWSGIAGAPMDAGAYRVRSNFAGNINYTSGSSDWTAFAINQIAATITVSRTSGDYDGNIFEATGEATGLNGIVLSPSVMLEYEQYDGSTWSRIVGAPMDAGAYRVRSNFAGNTNYTSGSSDWTAFAINQIAATITVSRTSGDYNGNPFEAMGSASGLEGDLSPAVTFEFQDYDGSTWSGIAGAPRDAGAYRVRSNFAGNTNYTSGSSDWTAFTIDKGNASVTPNAYSKYCGEEDPEDLSGTLAGFISRDNVTATYSITGDVISATLSPVGVLGNYNITYNTAVFSIFDVVIDVSASGTAVPLGATATLTASIVPAVSGVSVQFLVDNVPYSTVLTNNGTATIDVPGLELGVYKITAIAGNDCSESIAYLPVYDPDGNFVTGGGWIMSPRGAYMADESLTGKANFGFLSKYKKGSNQVDGNTEFQFKSGDLNFKSTYHESGTLVISGKKATYRGEGTINGQLGYKFTLVALDGDWNGGSGPDEFRIKIWGSSGIIYDNGIGLDDNSDAATSLGGGSIVIHEGIGKANKRVVADLVAVPWNTSSEEIEKKISSMSADWFERKDVKLTINTASYNALQPGFYEFNASLVENEWFALEEPITVNVLVADKPLATDIQLSNTIIQRGIRNGSVIGDLRTIDPMDDQHTYSIATQSDFELVGSTLIWKGNAIPEKAIITVFSMDRAGQTIERAFELSREPRLGDFNMFPNPAESEVTIEVELDQTVIVGINIFDAVGRLVYEEEGVQSGNLTYQINIDDLSSGMYTVQLITDRLVVNKILIKK